MSILDHVVSKVLRVLQVSPLLDRLVLRVHLVLRVEPSPMPLLMGRSTVAKITTGKLLKVTLKRLLMTVKCMVVVGQILPGYL
jgi:hypothetical protein